MDFLKNSEIRRMASSPIRSQTVGNSKSLLWDTEVWNVDWEDE